MRSQRVRSASAIDVIAGYSVLPGLQSCASSPREEFDPQLVQVTDYLAKQPAGHGRSLPGTEVTRSCSSEHAAYFKALRRLQHSKPQPPLGSLPRAAACRRHPSSLHRHPSQILVLLNRTHGAVWSSAIKCLAWPRPSAPAGPFLRTVRTGSSRFNGLRSCSQSMETIICPARLPNIRQGPLRLQQ